MRVRLYAVGSPSQGPVLRFDRLPVMLECDPQEGLHEARTGQPGDFCFCEEHGQLFLKTLSRQQIPRVNEAAMLCGVIDPGDHLRVGEVEYLISYERTGNSPAPASRFVIQPFS